MKHYKELLLNKLMDTSWELVEENSHVDWWIESSWKLRSLKQAFGYEIFILFLVDPQYDGKDKSSAVWTIGAYRKIPKDRPLEDGISTMDMVKGKFDEKVVQFVSTINEYRKELHS